MGPRDLRPACKQFARWLELSDEANRRAGVDLSSGAPVLSLPLFQPSDSKQLAALFLRVRKLPDLIYYYLRQHVFPSTMTYQNFKVPKKIIIKIIQGKGKI